MLLHDHLVKRGIRDATQMHVVSPQPRRSRCQPGPSEAAERTMAARGVSSTPSVVGPPSPGPPARVVRETRKSLCRSRRSSSSHPIIACTRTLLPGRIRYAKPCRLHGIHLRRRPDRPILGADRDGPISRPHPRDPASPTEARQYWARIGHDIWRHQRQQSPIRGLEVRRDKALRQIAPRRS